MTSFITRKKHGKKFDYYQDETKITSQATIKRIDALAIPPAWTNVEIAKNERSKIQARGRDSAGRIQAIYHQTYRQAQEAAKFRRILQFAERLPALRRVVEHDLNKRIFSKEKVMALVVKLMDEAYFRVGNHSYAKANHTYGITTLRRKHFTLKTETIEFDFIGKSGQKHHKKISDRRLARIMKQLDDIPGYDLFQYYDSNGQKHRVDSNDVNRYIKKHMGAIFSAKDFRTWGGTLIAVSELAISKPAKTKKDRQKRVTKVIKRVARRLGNTPTVAKNSYIDPRVITSYLTDDSIATTYQTMSRMRPKKYLKTEERCVIELLKIRKSH